MSNSLSRGFSRFMSWYLLVHHVIITAKGGFSHEPTKIGIFLKQLSKEKGLTQEQLAEQFYVSSRTVSRWETGCNMPDIATLIELADFYQIDIREMINGERKSENMHNEIQTTLTQVAEYATQNRKKKEKKLLLITFASGSLWMLSKLLFQEESQGFLYGVVPENICNLITRITCIIAYIALFGLALYAYDIIDKLKQWKQKRR